MFFLYLVTKYSILKAVVWSIISRVTPVFYWLTFRSGASICAQSLHHQCCSTRDGPLCCRTSRSRYAGWGLFWWVAWSGVSLFKTRGRRCINTNQLSDHFISAFASRSSSDASPVLWCDPLGRLPCQSLPTTGGCSEQLGQSAGSKSGPAEPTAGQKTWQLSYFHGLISSKLVMFLCNYEAIPRTV